MSAYTFGGIKIGTSWGFWIGKGVTETLGAGVEQLGFEGASMALKASTSVIGAAEV